MAERFEKSSHWSRHVGFPVRTRSMRQQVEAQLSKSTIGALRRSSAKSGVQIHSHQDKQDVPPPHDQRYHQVRLDQRDEGESGAYTTGRSWSMGKALRVKTCVLALAFLCIRAATVTGEAIGSPSSVCADFGTGLHTDSGWTYDDCVQIWTEFNNTIWWAWHTRMPDADLWSSTSLELRQAGSPCLVTSTTAGDGVGSTTIRHLATWIFSREMGCDWVTPSWGKKKVGKDSGSAVMYCHRTGTSAEMDRSKTREEQKAMRRCAVVDWLSYFQFDIPSVPLPSAKRFNIVQPIVRTFSKAIVDIQQSLQENDISRQDVVIFALSGSVASQKLVNIGSWDRRKRDIVRDVLQEARRNFHRHPRSWYDGNANCQYDASRLHLAIHVRMGDRRAFFGDMSGYFERLEAMMFLVSEETRSRGLPQPLFHVFSETLAQCPSEISGLFDEFPTWPVELHEVGTCRQATRQSDCEGDRAGGACNSRWPGIFRIQGKNIVLHVGTDVQNDLSCMIQADGVFMGCSTFGQIAGLLTQGISFFSTRCGGRVTPVQYVMIPPMAVSEMGRLWVPIEGSWHDPTLTSTSILKAAISTLLATRAGHA